MMCFFVTSFSMCFLLHVAQQNLTQKRASFSSRLRAPSTPKSSIRIPVIGAVRDGDGSLPHVEKLPSSVRFPCRSSFFSLPAFFLWNCCSNLFRYAYILMGGSCHGVWNRSLLWPAILPNSLFGIWYPIVASLLIFFTDKKVAFRWLHGRGVRGEGKRESGPLGM